MLKPVSSTGEARTTSKASNFCGSSMAAAAGWSGSRIVSAVISRIRASGHQRRTLRARLTGAIFELVFLLPVWKTKGARRLHRFRICCSRSSSFRYMTSSRPAAVCSVDSMMCALVPSPRMTSKAASVVSSMCAPASTTWSAAATQAARLATALVRCLAMCVAAVKQWRRKASASSIKSTAPRHWSGFSSELPPM